MKSLKRGREVEFLVSSFIVLPRDSPVYVIVVMQASFGKYVTLSKTLACFIVTVFNFLSIKNGDEFLDILTGISDLQTLLECPVGATNIMLEDSSPNFLG